MNSDAELCSYCGIEMMVIVNPSSEMLHSSGGLKELITAAAMLDIDLEIDSLHMAFCTDCNSTAIIGPRIQIGGRVVGNDEHPLQ